MRTTSTLGIAMSVALAAGCGGKAEPADQTLQAMPIAGIGDCVDPAPAATIARVTGADDKGRVQICRDDGVECRAVDVATGAMTEHYPQRRAATSDQPLVSVEDDGQLLVCWGGPTSCQRRTPTAYEKWLGGQIAAGSVAVLGAEGTRKWVTTMDAKLTTVLRFEVIPSATDVVWIDGRFLVHAAAPDGASTHGYLYDGKGTPRGVAGALGGATAFDIGAASPTVLLPGRWAFLARDASAVATHDLDRGDGTRIELGITGQALGASALGGYAGTTAVVALGGEAYGDVVAVDVATNGIKRWNATRCQP